MREIAWQVPLSHGKLALTPHAPRAGVGAFFV
jgi:hypothetical protein